MDLLLLEPQADTGITSFIGHPPGNDSVGQGPGLGRSLLEFHGNIHAGLAGYRLPAGEKVAVKRHRPVSGRQQHRRLTLPEIEAVNGALLVHGIIGMDGFVLKVHGESVGRNMLIVIRYGNNGRKLSP